MHACTHRALGPHSVGGVLPAWPLLMRRDICAQCRKTKTQKEKMFGPSTVSQTLKGTRGKSHRATSLYFVLTPQSFSLHQNLERRQPSPCLPLAVRLYIHPARSNHLSPLRSSLRNSLPFASWPCLNFARHSYPLLEVPYETHLHRRMHAPHLAKDTKISQQRCLSLSLSSREFSNRRNLRSWDEPLLEQ